MGKFIIELYLIIQLVSLVPKLTPVRTKYEKWGESVFWSLNRKFPPYLASPDKTWSYVSFGIGKQPIKKPSYPTDSIQARNYSLCPSKRKKFSNFYSLSCIYVNIQCCFVFKKNIKEPILG